MFFRLSVFSIMITISLMRYFLIIFSINKQIAITLKEKIDNIILKN